MKIVVLDKKTLGDDTPFNEIEKHGEIKFYDTTEPRLVVEHACGADVIIVNKVKITEAMMAALPALKLICVFATGYDNIDISAARKYGIAVCNVPAYSSNSVAMYTVATVLALATHIRTYNRFVTSGEYTASGNANLLAPTYHEISGKIWGIIGYGNIGRAVAKIAEAMGAHVLVNKRTDNNSGKCVDIDTLCKKSDIITVHVPLTDKTRNMISKEQIAIMKKNVIIVNEARGAVLNESDIAEAVRGGNIAGFGCDVYSAEPFTKEHPYYSIMNMENVLLTPHAAWGAYEARERCARIIGENIGSFKAGESLNRVDI